MRTRADVMMGVGGVLVIFAQTLVIAETPLQFTVIFVSLLLVGAALWGLGHRLEPSSRIFLQLRAEVDQFLTLVRKLNAHAIAAERKQASAIKTAMHKSVDRVALVAGVVEGQSWRGNRWPKLALKKRFENLVNGALRPALYPTEVGQDGRDIAVVQTHQDDPHAPSIRVC